MKAKITFKKEPKETGLRAVGNPYPNTIIKHDGLKIGFIQAPSWMSPDMKWRIRLMLKEDKGWQYRTLKIRFNSEPEARQFIVEHADKIIEMGLHHLEA